MRIIGGQAAGRLLKVPPGFGVRPTPDLARQVIFWGASMKTFIAHFLIFWMVIFISSSCAANTSEVLPGVNFHDGPEELKGKIAFLKLDSFKGVIAEQTNNASIYEYDLGQKNIREIRSCPYGDFLASSDGSIYCILYGESKSAPYFGTNAFIYSNKDHRVRTVALPGSPENTILLGNHAYFQIQSNGLRLLDYDLIHDSLRDFVLPGASRWEYESYKIIQTPCEATNILYIKYARSSECIKTGTNYAEGYYCLNIVSGEVSEAPKAEYELFSPLDIDGRYVFFNGPDPLSGHTLVSSPWDSFDTKKDHANAKELRVLRKFPLLGGIFYLEQLSPCRRFVLIRQTEQISRSSGKFGEINTYYLVDVISGKTRILVKDDVAKTNDGHLSILHWVGMDTDIHVKASSPPLVKGPTAKVDDENIEISKSMEEAFQKQAAILRRFAQDSKRKGYRVIFTDIGPESLERDKPQEFEKFIRMAKIDGVTVRGLSRVKADERFVRDKETGEKGVGFMFVAIEDAPGSRCVFRGIWWEAKGRTHDLQYTLTKNGRSWRVE